MRPQGGPQVFVVSNRGVRRARLAPLQGDMRTTERQWKGRRQRGVQFETYVTTGKPGRQVTTSGWSEKTWVDAQLVHSAEADARRAFNAARQSAGRGSSSAARRAKGTRRSIEDAAIANREGRP